jgi:large subunit ribosomal protein L5
MASRYVDIYKNDVIPKLQERFNYDNVNRIPRLKKIVVNVGVGAASRNAKLLENATEELTTINRQKPKNSKARKSVANFNLRKGMSIGSSVTLRSDRMLDFLDRFINIAVPRIRDFRGLNPNSFDGRGNYTMGITEQIIFPEIEYDKIEQIRGLNITFVTSAETDEEAFELLSAFGFPFKRT